MIASGTDFHVAANTWGASGLATSNQVNALDSVSNNFKLAFVQLESSASASGVGSAFESRGALEEFFCMRYAIPLSAFASSANGAICQSSPCMAASIDAELKFPVVMRAAPTLSSGN